MNFDNIDWVNNNDTSIARIVGCSREWVRQVRKKEGKPLCIFKNRQAEFQLRRKKLEKLPPGLTIDEIAKQLDMQNHMRYDSTKQTWVVQSVVYQFCIDNGYKIRRRSNKKPWHLINWDLPDADLNYLYGYKNIGTQRCRLGWAPRWSYHYSINNKNSIDLRYCCSKERTKHRHALEAQAKIDFRNLRT